MTTRNTILEYMEKLEGQTFELDKLKKSRDDYRKGYEMHKMACDFILPKIDAKILPLAEKIPSEQEVFIKADKPDYALYKKGKYILFDVKYKSKVEYFGWVNVRAYKTYKQCSDDLGIPLYVLSTNLDKIGHFSIQWEPIKKDIESWDKNRVHIFEWKEGVPF